MTRRAERGLPRWFIGGATLCVAIAGVAFAVHAARHADDAAVAPSRVEATAATAPPSVSTIAVSDVGSQELSASTGSTGRAGPGRPAYLSIVVPTTIAVGETVDVEIAIDAPREVRSVSFTVKLDPDVAQIRAIREGTWTTDTGVPSAFSADVQSGDGGAFVRSILPRAATSDRRADVAVVQIQAVAPGRSAIVLADLQTGDAKGLTIPVSMSSQSQNAVRVESTLPGRP